MASGRSWSNAVAGSASSSPYRPPHHLPTGAARRRESRPRPPTAEADVAGGVARLAVEDPAPELGRYEVPVEVSGADVPPPAELFAEAGLPEAVARNVRYERPTPVQRHALPILLAGRDLMACAQTGSGKTAAFCLPIVSRLVAGGGGAAGERAACGRAARPRALVLAPTRELAGQIHEEARKFCCQTGVKVVVAYGGTPIHNQLRDLERGVDILVATPGRLVDLVERSRLSLEAIEGLALDEADRMLDMGFEPQIRKIIERMNMPPKSLRQTMLFSATFPPEIQRLASDFLSNHIFLTVGRVGSSTDLISQRVEFVPYREKRGYLVDILRMQSGGQLHGKQALTLVFVETKREADSLECWLCTRGFPATSIHGDRSQQERERALRSFKSGATPVMVATDVASRGLDVPNVAHVVNYDLPKSIDDYVHRIGRTGRAGKAGLATAFFTDADHSLAKGLIELMTEAKQDTPEWLVQYAERPYCGGSSYVGRSGRSSGGRFRGRDYRSSGDYYGGDSYGGGAPNYNYYPSHGYALGTDQITASGWD